MSTPDDRARPPKPTYRFAGDAPPAPLAHLRNESRWVAWRYEWRGNKWTKPPLAPATGRAAKSNDPATWGTFDEALALVRRRKDLAGVGVMLTDDGDLSGADLDHCISDSGSFSPLAADVLELAETYAETSPSGEGVRIFIAGKAPETFKLPHAEVYNRQGRYLTVTGQHIDGTPLALAEAPRTLARLERERPRRQANGHAAPMPRSDEAERCRDALRAVPSDDYATWIDVGMALQDGLGDAGFAVWREWSMASAKFDDGACRQHWRSFNPGGGKTLATVFGLARERGWHDERREAPRAASPPRQGQAEQEKPQPAAPLVAHSAWDLLKSEAPPRVWHIEHWLPGDDVTGFFADGGTGKTVAGLQLAWCTAVGFPFLGMTVRTGGSLYLSAEESPGELAYRLHQIATGIVVPDGTVRYPFEVISRAGEDALLCRFTKAGAIEPTPIWSEIVERISDLKCSFVGIDPAADVYGGDENDRAQVRQFINMLRKPAIEHRCAILLAGHASVDGLKTGRGYSGSTAWHNSVRARWYLSTPKVESEEPDRDLRHLELAKTNRGQPGKRLALRWREGVFATDGGNVDIMKLAEAKVRFLELLAAYTAQGRVISDQTGKNYAPARFAQDEGGKPFGSALYAKAMAALFHEGRLCIETVGPPSKQRSKLVAV